MKTVGNYLIPVLVIIVCFSCSSGNESTKESKPELEPTWSYGEDAIRLLLKSDPALNSYDGLPHTLHFCFYQLRDPNAFNQLSGDEVGLSLLLECGTFDPSVTGFKRITVQPGQDLTLTMDRAEGSRYVGLAVGYYTLEKERIVRLEKIPIQVKRKFPMVHQKYALPGILKLEVQLGSKQIEKVRTKK